MKICDFVHQTKLGVSNPTMCRIRIFCNIKQESYAVFTDLDNNTGPSVTNSVEDIWQDLLKQGHIREDTKVIEHYESELFRGESFDWVTFDKSNKPSWKKTRRSEICLNLGCRNTEFSERSLDNRSIFEATQKSKHSINPYIDEPFRESFDIINRRVDINENKISKKKIIEFIESNPKEKDIQTLFERDLSILGDYYSNPKEEYICFSQFPVGDRIVDFVVFTGRSRMDVTLIEIKGADYNLLNKDNYETFSKKTDKAIRQITRELGYISRNYPVFRPFCHKIKKKAESGEQIYKAFIGPKGKLEASPDKDICIHTSIIGGRSNNDIKESKVRHDFERHSSPPIRIDSWDSWINKLDR